MSNAEIDELLRLMNEEAEERWKKAAEEEFKPDIMFRVKMNEPPVIKEPRMFILPPLSESGEAHTYHQVSPEVIKWSSSEESYNQSPFRFHIVIYKDNNETYYAKRYSHTTFQVIEEEEPEDD